MVDSHPPSATRHPKNGDRPGTPAASPVPGFARSLRKILIIFARPRPRFPHDAMYRLTTMVTNGSSNFRKASPNGNEMKICVATDYSIFFGVCDSFYSCCDMNMGMNRDNPISNSYEPKRMTVKQQKWLLGPAKMMLKQPKNCCEVTSMTVRYQKN